MPLNLNCPSCGQEAIVPDTAINRRVRCTSCHAVYAVRDALNTPVAQQSPIPEPVADDSMSKNEKLLIAFGLGIPALIFLVFLTYWFGIRDTWETDNYSEITTRCEAVMQATRESNDLAADQAFAELTAFIGDRSIESDSLADKLASVNSAMVPVHERLEQERREREASELAERKRRDALAEERRRAQLARDAEFAASSRQDSYKGFTESELQRLYNKLQREGYSSEEAILTVKSMLDYPDTRATAREWLRRN